MKPRAISLLVLLTASACTSTPEPPPVLVDPAALAGPDLRLEQSLLGHFYGRKFLARGVIVKQGRTLDVWMLTPTGQRLLHVRQQRKQVESRALAEPWTGMDPRYLLRDVRWMFFERCLPPEEGRDEPTECLKGRETFVEHPEPGTELPRRLEIYVDGGGAAVDFGDGTVDCGGHRVPRRVKLSSTSLDYAIEALVDRCQVLGPDGAP